MAFAAVPLKMRYGLICLIDMASSVKGRPEDDRRGVAPTLFRRARVRDQTVEVHADVRCLGGGVGQGDGALEGGAGLAAAAELQEQRALHPEIMEVTRQLVGQRL